MAALTSEPRGSVKIQPVKGDAPSSLRSYEGRGTQSQPGILGESEICFLLIVSQRPVKWYAWSYAMIAI